MPVQNSFPGLAGACPLGPLWLPWPPLGSLGLSWAVRSGEKGPLGSFRLPGTPLGSLKPSWPWALSKAPLRPWPPLGFPLGSLGHLAHLDFQRSPWPSREIRWDGVELDGTGWDGFWELA